jgi:hypothetical protein
MLAPSSLAVESRNESWFDGEERTRETLAFRRELGVMRRLANYSDTFLRPVEPDEAELPPLEGYSKRDLSLSRATLRGHAKPFIGYLSTCHIGGWCEAFRSLLKVLQGFKCGGMLTAVGYSRNDRFGDPGYVVNAGVIVGRAVSGIDGARA